jgi:hypothetical protein
VANQETVDLKTGDETANQEKHRQEKELMLAQPPDLQSSWQSSHRAVAGADAAGASAGAYPSRVYLKTFCAHTGKSSLNREAPISSSAYRMACKKGGIPNCLQSAMPRSMLERQQGPGKYSKTRHLRPCIAQFTADEHAAQQPAQHTQDNLAESRRDSQAQAPQEGQIQWIKSEGRKTQIIHERFTREEMALPAGTIRHDGTLWQG